MRSSLYFHRFFIACMFVVAFLYGAVARGQEDLATDALTSNLLVMTPAQLAEVRL